MTDSPTLELTTRGDNSMAIAIFHRLESESFVCIAILRQSEIEHVMAVWEATGAIMLMR